MEKRMEYIDGTDPSRDFARQQEKERRRREFEHRVALRADAILCEIDDDQGEHYLAEMIARRELTPKRVGPRGVQLGIDTIDDLIPFAADHIVPKLEGLKELLKSVKLDLENA